MEQRTYRRDGRVFRVSGLPPRSYKGGVVVNTTRHSPALMRQLIIALAMVSIILLAPAWAILANSGPAAASPTGSVQPIRHHGGPNYWPITGSRRRPE